MARLTDPILQSAMRSPPTGRKDFFDGLVPGLMVRVGKRGHATWSLQLRVKGQGGTTPRGHRLMGPKFRVTLGEYPELTIAAARSLASVYVDQARQGVSPVDALTKQARAGGLTIQKLAEKFLDEYVGMKRLRSVLKVEGAIRVHIIPMLGTTIADMLSREQVRRFVRDVMNRVPRGTRPRDRPRGGTEAARTALAVLRRMMSWAMREELLLRDTNPAVGMEENFPRKRQKERVLSLDETRLVWRAAGALGYPFGPIYRLILLTGCRPGEWAKADRDWIDLGQALCVIPADSYKTEHVHVVPLVREAVETLRPVLTEHRGRKGGFVFSGTEGEKPVSGWSKAHDRMLKACCAENGERTMKPWTPHGLRRTVATRIAEQLGAGGEQLIKRVLGHADGSVTAIYNRYGYVKEMRAALEEWASQLTAMGDPAEIDTPCSRELINVVPLRGEISRLAS